ncbi:WbqC family protein [Pedobacter arcticus]|uniref:WbqC family protein n=1 Tax=Pedobacter arcticus TaxID=752140 RepID=UPI0002F4CA93|nr:WbqC family protein [Pedobacter arcticus]
MKKILITQSNYIPWKGYFDAIASTDIFVVYDDMQYTKRDWRNRNLIKTEKGLKWLSIPVEVKGKYFQKVNETMISDKNWNNSHLNILKASYKNAPHYKEIITWLESLYSECNFLYLTEINLYFIEKINEFLGIETTIVHSTHFNLHEERTQRLVNICKELNGTDYYSGPAAKTYMEEAKFNKENIGVHYFDYSNYPEYPQLYSPFEHGVSVLDLIFNQGSNAKNFLKTNING